MNTQRRIVLKDATLREGLDTPKVFFSPAQKWRIARELEAAGVSEAEIVAPSRVLSDLEDARVFKEKGLSIRLSGLIYSKTGDCDREIEAASRILDRFDLLMPASPKRAPFEAEEKLRLLKQAVNQAAAHGADFGVGFPHCFHANPALLTELAEDAVRGGAQRITLYDTNGSRDPFEVHNFVTLIKNKVRVPIFFHGHNDLGMATANSVGAVQAGADGLDVTVNGLGDRAGNAPLEQVVAALYLKGYLTGVRLEEIKGLCAKIAAESGVDIAKLAPVVGEYVCWHRSPSHLRNPSLFEAFDPELFRVTRQLTESEPQNGSGAVVPNDSGGTERPKV
ncbi:MAG TPA: LeuA family protein [Terriglobales bacterium]|jgi:homocitrate synthase NifV|nr:LeuA family protein [Terriglobales bacterium]